MDCLPAWTNRTSRYFLKSVYQYFEKCLDGHQIVVLLRIRYHTRLPWGKLALIGWTWTRWCQWIFAWRVVSERDMTRIFVGLCRRVILREEFPKWGTYYTLCHHKKDHQAYWGCSAQKRSWIHYQGCPSNWMALKSIVDRRDIFICIHSGSKVKRSSHWTQTCAVTSVQDTQLKL